MDVPMQPSSFVDFWLTLPEQNVKMKKSGLSLKSDPSCPSMPPQQHTDGDDELGHEHPWRIIRAEKESVRACTACKWILPRFSSLWIPDDKARRMINGTEGWNTAGNYIPNIWMDCLHFMVHQLLPSSFLGFQTPCISCHHLIQSHSSFFSQHKSEWWGWILTKHSSPYLIYRYITLATRCYWSWRSRLTDRISCVINFLVRACWWVQ